MTSDGESGRADASTGRPSTDLLAHRARATPERTAVVDAASDGTTGDGATGDEADGGEATVDGALTYAELDRLADDTAALLADRGAGPDEPVAALLGQGPGVAASLFAALRLGAPFVPLDSRRDESTLADQLSRVEPAVLVRDDGAGGAAGTGETGQSAANGSIDDAVDDVAVLDGSALAFDEAGRAEDATDERRRGAGSSVGTPAEEPSGNPVPWDGTAVVAFTSGTTGAPKGVRLTPTNLVASAVASAFRLGTLPEDRWLAPLRPCHVGGFAPFVRATLYGTSVVCQRSFDPDATARAVAEHDVTGLSLVPTMLARLLDDGWHPPDHLRVVLLGGGPAPEALLERCRRRDVPVRPTYGTTETASQVATARPGESVDGAVGRPLLWTGVTIVGPDGEPRDPGDEGEITVAGPTVSPGYLDAARTERSRGQYGFETGDLGYRDEAGRLRITGRADDRIVTGGENVDAGAVAAAIRDHAAVADAVVVGVPDSEWGQRVCALVEAASGSDDLSPAAVREHCGDRVADYAVPKTVRVVDALPRTVSGTVDREAARALLDADRSDVDRSDVDRSDGD